MELYLKRYFWVFYVLLVMLCAYLSARAFTHYAEARLIAIKPKAHKAAHKAPVPPPRAPTAAAKDGALVVTRNIFCSTCEPAVAVAPPPTTTSTQPVATSGAPPITALPLLLHVTAVAEDPDYSSATISNLQTSRSGLYFTGETIPDAGKIVSISPRYVDFENQAAGRVERLDLLGAQKPPPAVADVSMKPAEAPPPPADTSNPEGAFLAEVDKGVRKIDETHYEIDRSLVDKVLGDPNLIARQARIVPSIKDGKANGFKVYAIRPNSVYAKIGMQNGDTIQAVNGFEMTSPDKALEVYTKVKSASNLSITLTRRGQPVEMEYTIK